MTEQKTTPPLKPTALINFKKTDDELARIIGNFWKLTWNKEHPAIDQKTKYLLSLANAVGAGRHRQATRELVKAYADGVAVAELDEAFFELHLARARRLHLGALQGDARLEAIVDVVFVERPTVLGQRTLRVRIGILGIRHRIFILA